MKTIFTILFLLLIDLTFGQTVNDSIIAMFGGQINGELTKDEILKADSVQLFIRVDKKNINAKVISFNIVVLYTGMELEISNNTNELNNNQIDAIINKIAINQTLYIESIRVLCENKITKVNDIKIKISGLQLYLFDKTNGISYRYKTVIDTNDIRMVYRKLIPTNSTISKKQFLDNKFLQAGNDYEIYPNLQITEYSFQVNTRRKYKPITVTGDSITDDIKNIVKKLRKGDEIQIYKTKAIDKDNKEYEIGFYRFTLTD
ncbi:MAG TPA: hypothetical protein PKG63_06525 [Bacteroidales bacterium]|nr:hypothetical protein [Bacteroidales bacterium]